MTTTQVETDFGQIAVTETPGGAGPLLLLHGLTRSADDWLPITSRLAGRLRMLAVDFPGHGRSDDIDRFDWRDGAALVSTLIDALHLDRVFVAGHSLGGLVATVAAADDSRIAGVVNVDGHGAGHLSQFDGLTPEEAASGMQLFKDRSLEAFDGMEAEITAAQAAQEIDEMRRLLLTLPLIHEEADAVARAAYQDTATGTVRRRPSANVTSSIYLSLSELDIDAYYRKLGCPVIVIRTATDAPGEASGDPEIDRLIAAVNRGIDRQLDALVRERSNIVLRPFSCGHGVTLEAPDELAELLGEFVVSSR